MMLSSPSRHALANILAVAGQVPVRSPPYSLYGDSDQNEHAMKLPDGPEERRPTPRQWTKIISLMIVASVVIITIMALAYAIGRTLWG